MRHKDLKWPHKFVSTGFIECCDFCGLDRNTADQSICEHDTAWHCNKCPRGHTNWRKDDE